MKKNSEEAAKDIRYIFFGVQHPPCFNFKDDAKEEAEWSTPVRDPELAQLINNDEYHFNPPPTWDED